VSSLYHVENSAWSARDNVKTMLESSYVLREVFAPNTAVNLNIHEVPQGQANFLTLFCKFSRWR